MSKKSRDRCCDSDTDTKSTSTYGRSRASSSIKSTLSSAKDEPLAGPSGDYGCSSYTSTFSSSCSSPHTSTCLADEIKEEAKSIFHTSSMYLDKLKMYRKQLNLTEPPQLATSTKSPKDSLFTQQRRIVSAPPYAVKRISANSCKLQSIDEDEERGCGSSDFSVVSSKNPKDIPDNWDESTKQTEEVKITPRCIEVPPKRPCIRDKTPEIIYKKAEALPQLNQMAECCQNSGNKRFSIGDKDFILRKVNTENIACVSTQTKDAFMSETDSDRDFYTSKSYSRNLEGGDTSNFVHSVDMGLHLPQSVEDPDIQPIALEPNIIIIDTDEERKKSRSRIKRIGAIGDVSTDSGKSRGSDGKEKGDAYQDIFEDITKPAMDEPIPSTSYTPVYLVSTVFSDTTLQENAKKSEIDFSSRYYSNTEVIEREIKTIYPDPSDVFRADRIPENFSDLIDVKSYKGMLMDYSTGIQPTRTFPVHFDDLETLENEEEDRDADRFKQKASECLQFVNSRHKRIATQLNQSTGNIETERRSQVTKNASIIDMRKSQQTNIDYYLVGSSSESSIISEVEADPPSPGVKPDVIQWELDEEAHCCSCFASLRFL